MQPQDHARASLAPPIGKEECRVDWNLPARQVHDRIRGLNSFPGAFTTQGGEVVKLWRSRVVEAGGPAGMVLEAGPRLLVACGEGAVELLEIQLAGRRRQAASEALNGWRIGPRTTLGN